MREFSSFINICDFLLSSNFIFLFWLRLGILILKMALTFLSSGASKSFIWTIHVKCLASSRHLVGIVSFFLHIQVGVTFHWCLGDIISSMRPNFPKSGERSWGSSFTLEQRSTQIHMEQTLCQELDTMAGPWAVPGFRMFLIWEEVQV